MPLSSILNHREKTTYGASGEIIGRTFKQFGSLRCGNHHHLCAISKIGTLVPKVGEFAVIVSQLELEWR